MVQFHTVESSSQFMAVACDLLEDYGHDLLLDTSSTGFDEELKALPGRYGAPAGSLLVLALREQGMACGGFRKLDESVCELRRVYVRPDFRGMGMGRMISEELMRRALSSGYRTIKLEALTTMHAAHELYRSLGFRETHRSNGNGGPGTVHMERMLKSEVGL